MFQLKMFFDFGENWTNYSKNSLTLETLEVARNSLVKLFGDEGLYGKRFLDIGSGTGIFSIAALQLGARRAVGVDINPKCIEIGEKNAIQFLRKGQYPEFKLVSVLDEAAMAELGTFDVVYAWGSLHHTGNMYKAITHVLNNVGKNGKLCLAIYNRHFTSPGWNMIKYLYNLSPRWLRKMWVGCFFPIIYMAKFLITFQNPFKMQRGMNLYYDVVDWVGGYPYEYASEQEILDFVVPKGFQHIRTFPAMLPTGNNEFVFGKV